MCIVFDDLDEITNQCLAPIDRDESNRGRSWDRCYAFFQRYHRQDALGRREMGELACLHLGFYLASWGMFRGSGALMHKDYTVYGPVIGILHEARYALLWRRTLWRQLLKGGNPVQPDDVNIRLVLELKGRLEEFINGLMLIKSHAADAEHAHATDTIVSKILLGTMCCIPAYDTYFRQGLRIYGIRPYNLLSERSLTRLLNTCRERGLWGRLLEQPIGRYGVSYPIMRVVDLYFWTVGFNSRQRNAKKKARAQGR